MAAVRFAVAGFKHFHILEFVRGMAELPGAEFVGLYDDDPALRSQYAEQFGAPAFDSLERMVEATQPDVVGLAEVNSRKADAIEMLTQLGCHVLADKPLVTSLEQLDQVERAGDDNHRQVGLMLLERYHGPTRAVRRHLREGKLGRLVSFIALAPHKLRPQVRPAWMFQPELYGGVINDLAIHTLDIARWLWDSEPVAVTAVEGLLRFTQFDGFTDHGEALVEFDDSSTLMARVDWLTPEAFPSHGDGRQFYECTEGTIEVAAAPDIHTLGQGAVTLDPWHGARTPLAPDEPPASLYTEFVGLCQGQSQAELYPRDAFRSTRLALYAREAARTRQRIDLRGKL